MPRLGDAQVEAAGLAVPEELRRDAPGVLRKVYARALAERLSVGADEFAGMCYARNPLIDCSVDIAPAYQLLYAVPMSDVAALTSVQLTALADEIAAFAARIDIAEHVLITNLRIFDAHDGWTNSGFLSTAQWLSWRTHIGPNAAREKVRVARALAELPQLDSAFARGELSYSKVRAITRVATPQTEQHFIDVAQHATASQIERLTRAYKRCRELADDSNPFPRDERRFVRRSVTPGGMVRIEMQFPPEEANVVWEAVESAGEQVSAEASKTENGQSCTDAPDSRAGNVSAGTSESRADAVLDLARAYLHHRPRTLGSAYELVILTTKQLLSDGQDGIGGFLRDGTPIPVSIVRRIASDSARVDAVVDEYGELLDVGRRTRSIPSAIGRALWLRDGGCRMPGCGRKRHLHGHHIQAWTDGGSTSLANLTLVCSGHHRMIHEGNLDCAIVDGKIEFIDKFGRKIASSPPTGANGRDLEELEQFLRDADLHVDPSLNEPKWDGQRMDLGEALAWMFMAEQHPAMLAGASGRSAPE